jgi:hypothetical protein
MDQSAIKDAIAALREAVEAEKRQLTSKSDGARHTQRSAWNGAIAAIAVSCMLLGVAIGLSVDIGGPAIAPRPAPGSTTAQR